MSYFVIRNFLDTGIPIHAVIEEKSEKKASRNGEILAGPFDVYTAADDKLAELVGKSPDDRAEIDRQGVVATDGNVGYGELVDFSLAAYRAAREARP